MTDEKTCHRPGCTKKLRKDNAKGHCSSNCLSPSAPPAQRAKHVTAAPSSPAKMVEKLADEKAGATMIRFRLVAEALDLNPDEVIEEFAQEWLAGMKAKLVGG